MKKKSSSWRSRSVIAGSGKSQKQDKALKKYEAEKRQQQKEENAEMNQIRKAMKKIKSSHSANFPRSNIFLSQGMTNEQFFSKVDTVPKKMQKLGITSYDNLRKKVKSSNLDTIDFEFDNLVEAIQSDNPEDEKGILTISFKSGGEYEYSNCPFLHYVELLTGGKSGFYHHQGEKHSFKTLSRGHYFYYYIRDKYPTKKIK